MEFVRSKTLHELLVNNVYDFLRNESDGTYFINNTSNRPKDFWKKLVLKTGETVYPDIVDEENRLVYEIHVKGERRREYFDQLPDGWRGINVFIDEESNPQTLVVKIKKGNDDRNYLYVKRVKWDEDNCI